MSGDYIAEEPRDPIELIKAQLSTDDVEERNRLGDELNWAIELKRWVLDPLYPREVESAAGRLRVPPTAPVDPTAGATGLDDRHVALAVLGIAVLGVALGATVPALAPLSTLGPLVALLALVVFALHARR